MYTSVRNAPETPAGRGGVRGRASTGRVGTRVGGTVVAMGMVSFFTDASAEMVTAVLPLFLILQIGLTPLQYGVVDGIYQGVTVAVRLAGGYVADRWRRPKLVCGVGYGLSAVSKLGLLGVGSAASTSLVLAVDRSGKGLRTAPRDAIIAAVGRPRRARPRLRCAPRRSTPPARCSGRCSRSPCCSRCPAATTSVFVVSFCVALLGLAVLAFLVPERPLGAREPGQQRGHRAGGRSAAARTGGCSAWSSSPACSHWSPSRTASST